MEKFADMLRRIRGYNELSQERMATLLKFNFSLYKETETSSYTRMDFMQFCRIYIHCKMNDEMKMNLFDGFAETIENRFNSMLNGDVVNIEQIKLGLCFSKVITELTDDEKEIIEVILNRHINLKTFESKGNDIMQRYDKEDEDEDDY